MSNMSYCRFENTSRDLRDCLTALHDGETEDLSEYEEEGLKNLLSYCKEIAENYSEEDF